MSAFLVVQLARMGDLVQTKRLLLSLAAHKNSEIHLWVDSSLEGFAKQLYPFVNIHGLPAHGGSARSQCSTLVEFQKTLALLQGINFEKIYTLNSSALSTAIARAFPAEKVCGFNFSNNQKMRSSWVRLASRWTRERQTSPLNLVDYWAHFHHNPIAPELVNPIAMPAKSHTIGLVMAGRVPRRSLPPQTLALCLESIFRARSAPNIICLGSKTETPLVRQLLRLLPKQLAEKVTDTTGKTNLTDIGDILKGLDLLLTPDTGIMHLAAHLGVPTQSFFLSSAWCFETGAYGLGHRVWQSCIRCAPCLESAPCPNNEACLKDFSDKNFLLHLAGKHVDFLPQNLAGYVTAFDALGLDFTIVDGQNPHAQRRTLLRKFLFEYLHMGVQPSLPHSIADELLHETDWILAKDNIC